MGNDDDSGCSTEEYAWVPPGVSGELVSILRDFKSNEFVNFRILWTVDSL